MNVKHLDRSGYLGQPANNESKLAETLPIGDAHPSEQQIATDENKQDGESALESSRIIYLDILRIISICGVVLLHVSAYDYFSNDPLSFNWEVQNIYNGAVRWCVPIFVMISGTLFLGPLHGRGIKELLKKNILRMAIIIVTWGFIYTLIDIFFGNAQIASVGQFISTWLLGADHMWFLYMLLGLYLCIPIFKCITRDESVLKYCIVLLFLIGILFPFISSMLEGDLIGQLLDQTGLASFTCFPLYFLLGRFLWNLKIERRTYLICIFAFIGSTIIGIALTAALSIYEGSGNTLFYRAASITVFISTCALYICAKFLFDRSRRMAKMKASRLKKLSSFALGIYLAHIAVLDLAYSFGVSIFSFNPIFSIPILTVSVIAISATITFLLQRIPVIGKYCI